MPIRYSYRTLADFLISATASVDGELDDGWGATFPAQGREIEATVLFADISAFTERTNALSPTETLIFVNNFFAWISAEALSHGKGIVDKYIGDQIMVVYSNEFGSDDALGEALSAARWMGEHDVLGFSPHIGLASGLVTVGYVGTPLRYECSVFGRPVSLASRCAHVRRAPDGRMYSTSIALPASQWHDHCCAERVAPTRERRPDGSVRERPSLWEPQAVRHVDLKGLGGTDILEILHRGIRVGPTPQERAALALDALLEAGRYWPRAEGSSRRDRA
jgi:class 3 adenylate cyclase